MINFVVQDKAISTSPAPLFENYNVQVVIGGYDLYREELDNQPIKPLQSNGIEIITPSYLTGRMGELLIDEVSTSSDNDKIFETNFNENILFFSKEEKEGTIELNKKSFTLRENEIPNKNPISHKRLQSILIYVFADGEYYYPGFERQFGTWMEKEEIEKLTKIEGNEPWINL